MKKDIVQKQPYVKPSMKVFKLKERARLLVGSGEGGVENYNNGGKQTWP